jgi:cyanophycinase
VSGPLALVGSGEYLPVMQSLEARLIEGRPPRYVQIPTAAAQEGQATLDRWIALGVAQAERLGVQPVPVVVRDRSDADNAELAALVEGAGLVYLSGGSPSYLATTLHGTKVWDAVLRAWEGGAALAGCSAGAMALSGWAPYVRELDRQPETGLGVLPNWQVLPHFDQMPRFDPGFLDRVRSQLQDGTVLLGIDEDTALVRFDHEWVVDGRLAVHLLTRDGEQTYGHGEVVPV